MRAVVVGSRDADLILAVRSSRSLDPARLNEMLCVRGRMQDP